MDEMLQANPSFPKLVDKSKAGPRRPFPGETGV